eukprot:1196492-Heterocapsa_arctica.AAC.1
MALKDGQPSRQDGGINIGVAVVSNVFVFLYKRAEDTVDALRTFVISSPSGGYPRGLEATSLPNQKGGDKVVVVADN